MAKKAIEQPPYFVITDIGEAPGFWAFYGGCADGVVRDENPTVAVVMKATGEVAYPQIPSEEGFALLAQVETWLLGGEEE